MKNARVTDTKKKKKPLTLDKETLQNLVVRTGVKTGWLPRCGSIGLENTC